MLFWVTQELSGLVLTPHGGGEGGLCFDFMTLMCRAHWKKYIELCQQFCPGLKAVRMKKRIRVGCDSDNMRLVCTLMAVSFTTFQRK